MQFVLKPLYVKVMQITAHTHKLGRNLLQVWKSSSSEAIIEAIIWSQTLSLVDKCQAWTCEYPLAFGLAQIINKLILLKCHVELFSQCTLTYFCGSAGSFPLDAKYQNIRLCMGYSLTRRFG